MKRIFVKSLLLVLAFALSVGFFCACGTGDEGDLWEDALYHEDTHLGQGKKTLYIQIEAQEKSITLTLSTDKDTVGAAMTEHGLLEGEQGPYGLYVKKVNGMTADYDIDKSYWAFTKGGAYIESAADKTPIEDGATYEFVRTK